MHCRDCLHYLPSSEANQRAWLAGYGYCKSAPTVEQRARFFNDAGLCWLAPIRFEAKKK